MPEQCVCSESFAFLVTLSFCNSKSSGPEVFFPYILLWEMYLISNSVLLLQRA